MTGYCVSGHHEDCPDARVDLYVCSCPCHLFGVWEYQQHTAEITMWGSGRVEE